MATKLNAANNRADFRGHGIGDKQPPAIIGAHSRGTSSISPSQASWFLNQERKLMDQVAGQAIADEKFRLAVEACPNGMLMIGEDSKIVMANTEIERQFGYGRDELRGQAVEMLIPQRLRERYSRHRDAFTGLPESLRFRPDPNLLGLRKDGSEFALEIAFTTIPTADEILVLVVIVDVSERKDGERHLAQMESKYRGLLEAAPDAMVVVNHHGDIVLLNVQTEKQFGYRRDELLGQKVENIIPQGFAERLIADDQRSVEDALAQQIGTGLELIGRRKDASEFPIEIMLSPLEGPEGILVTAAIRNITSRKRLERLKDEFVATVSHELRTPLTSISGALGLLIGRAEKMSDASGRLLTIAHANSQRLVRLVNDILDTEKFESGRVTFKLARVDVRDLVEQAIDDNLGYASGYGVQIRLDESSVTRHVNADWDRLVQVITNLLSNAIKFSPADNEVVVAITASKDIVRISVRDRGHGIPAGFKPHIFEKFAQADATSTRQKGGTGLGLSIVKQIVERLGGQIGFDDAPGGGTIFHIELPVWDEEADQTIDLESEISAARILLCEDDRDVSALIRVHLRHAGFAVDQAYSSLAAVACASANRYAAMLVDLRLPDGNGIDLVLRLRAHAQYRDTPIIVISADLGRARDDARSSNVLKIMDWLTKPIDFERLIQVLLASIPRLSAERPRVLHIDDDGDVLLAVSQALQTIADVVSADTMAGARRALAAGHIDLVVLDMSLKEGSGLALLPELRDRFQNPIPVIIFSAQDASFVCSDQIEAALTKSDGALAKLVASVRDRLPFTLAPRIKELA